MWEPIERQAWTGGVPPPGPCPVEIGHFVDFEATQRGHELVILVIPVQVSREIMSPEMHASDTDGYVVCTVHSQMPRLRTGKSEGHQGPRVGYVSEENLFDRF